MLWATWKDKNTRSLLSPIGSVQMSRGGSVPVSAIAIQDPRAAKPLYDLLMQEGMTGHAFTDIEKAIAQSPPNPGDTSTRNKSLPVLILARALYRCGDHNGLGEKIMKSYANDLRGHYATHAKAVLAESARHGR